MITLDDKKESHDCAHWLLYSWNVTHCNWNCLGILHSICQPLIYMNIEINIIFLSISILLSKNFSWSCQSEEERWDILGADEWFKIGEDHKNDSDDDDDDGDGNNDDDDNDGNNDNDYYIDDNDDEK